MITGMHRLCQSFPRVRLSGVLFFDVQPDTLGRAGVSFQRAILYRSRDLHESRHGMVEKLFVAFAEIAFSREIVVIPTGSVFHAAAPADVKMAADKTFVAELLLGPCEGAFLLVGGESFQGRFENTAQPPLRLYEEFATENFARVLDNDKARVFFAVGADRVFAHDVVCHERIEIADVQLLGTVVVPEVEKSAQKIAVLFRRDREIRRLARRGVCFNAWDELQISQFVLDDEIKEFFRMFHVTRVQQDQSTEFDSVYFTRFDTSHHSVEGARSGVIEPIPVMKLLWPVDAYAEKELVVSEKPAPFVIK